MTVESILIKKIYRGNSVARDWPVPFTYSRTDDIFLMHTDAQGVETQVTSNFRVNKNASGDTSVTYPVSGQP